MIDFNEINTFMDSPIEMTIYTADDVLVMFNEKLKLKDTIDNAIKVESDTIIGFNNVLKALTKSYNSKVFDKLDQLSTKDFNGIKCKTIITKEVIDRLFKIHNDLLIRPRSKDYIVVSHKELKEFISLVNDIGIEIVGYKDGKLDNDRYTFINNNEYTVSSRLDDAGYTKANVTALAKSYNEFYNNTYIAYVSFLECIKKTIDSTVETYTKYIKEAKEIEDTKKIIEDFVDVMCRTIVHLTIIRIANKLFVLCMSNLNTIYNTIIDVEIDKDTEDEEVSDEDGDVDTKV